MEQKQLFPLKPTFSRSNIPWFLLGLTAIFLFSAALRFWGLGRFNLLVFDEVHNAKFANNYLTQTPFFQNHPPLARYIIALGIWLGDRLPFGQDIVNNLAGSELSTFSYRWMNALTGSLIPLVVAGIAYQLSRRRSFAFIAALLVAVDGLLLVESRYALNNIYLTIFGLLGQFFFLLALNRKGRWRGGLRLLAGICFGGCISVKWNGLGYMLGIYGVWFLAWGLQWLQSLHPRTDVEDTEPQQEAKSRPSPLQKLTRLDFRDLLFDLGVVPAFVYYLVWIPHLQLNPELGFWGLHRQILGSHTGVGSGAGEHPYCSSWYTWPWLIRPVGYFFAKVDGTPESASELGFPVSLEAGEKIYFDVHGIGNPVLWWLSSAAVILVLGILIHRLRIWMTTSNAKAGLSWRSPQIIELWIVAYLLINYAANWLPWMKVSRCAFLYHYMAASIFAFMALAWILESWLRGYDLFLRFLAVSAIFLILIAFVFWLPIFLGLPLSRAAFDARMWLESWY